MVAALLQAAVYQGHQRRRQIRDQFAQSGGLIMEVLGNDVGEIIPQERGPSREKMIEDTSDGIEIGSGVCLLAPREFGGEVERGA